MSYYIKKIEKGLKLKRVECNGLPKKDFMPGSDYEAELGSYSLASVVRQ